MFHSIYTSFSILQYSSSFVHTKFTPKIYTITPHDLLPYYQAQIQKSFMVFRPVNMQHIIDPVKNIDFTSQFIPPTFKEWPCDSFLVMANAKRIGN